MRLQTKISAWVLLILVISGAFTTWAVVTLQRQASMTEFTQLAGALGMNVKNSLRQDMLNARREDIRPTAANMARGPLINEINVFSADGSLAFSGSRTGLGNHKIDPAVAAVIRSGKPSTRYKRSGGNPEFRMLMPVENEPACYRCHAPATRVLGVVEVGLETGTLTSHASSDARTVVLIQLFGVGLILLPVSVVVRHAVVARLGGMLASIHKITDGNFSERIAVDSNDELGQLGKAFNEMESKVESTIGELAKANEQLDRSLLRFGKLLSTTLNLDDMADLILNELADSVESPEACLFLRQEKSDALVLLASRGVFKELVEEYNVEPVIWGQPPYTSSTFRSGAMLLDTVQEKHWLAEIARCHGSNDFYVFTLISGDRIVGLLTLVVPREAFTESRIHTLQALCHEAATGVETAQMHEQLTIVSITDALTQTYNQRHFFTVLKEELERAKRYGGVFSLVFLDLDNFKLFNDSYGHLAGDGILRQVSTLLSGLVRASDRVFRYGGDEFVLILPDTARESAVVLGDRIRDEIERRNFLPDGEAASFRLTASVGVTSYDAGRFDKEDEIFKAVDDALYRAKEAGRNRVVIG